MESLAYSSELDQTVCSLPEHGTHNARFRIRLGWEELLPIGHEGLDLALQVGRRESHWRQSSSALAIMAIATVSASILKMNRREQDQCIFDNQTKLLTVHYSDIPLVSIAPHIQTHTHRKPISTYSSLSKPKCRANLFRARNFPLSRIIVSNCAKHNGHVP